MPATPEGPAMSKPTIRGVVILLADPTTRTLDNGTRSAFAPAKFPMWSKDADDAWVEGEPIPVALRAYDGTDGTTPATFLASLHKGDKVELHGTVKPGVYNDKPQLEITAKGLRRPVKRDRDDDKPHGPTLDRLARQHDNGRRLTVVQGG